MTTFRRNLVASFTRLYPFYSGCATLANHPLIQKLAGVSDDTVWAAVTGGEVLAPLGDYVGRAAYYTGELDRKITWICSKLIRPGDTVLDIGANIGIVTLWMAKLVGPEGRVHAFEPNPRMIRLLKQVMQRNSLTNVTLHAIALGPESGNLKLHIPKFNAGMASLIHHRDMPGCEGVDVAVMQLAAVAEHDSIGSMRMIKIDVEGYEAEVFKGAESLFKASRPDTILFELVDYIGKPPTSVPLLQFLLERDYRFFAIPRSMARMRLQRFDPLVADKVTGHDFLAVAYGDNYQDIVHRVGASN